MPALEATLRSAAEGDVISIVQLLRRSWLTTWAPQLPFDAVKRFTETDPASTFVNECWKSFQVADVKGVTLAMSFVKDDILESPHVDPAAEGRGLGTLLLAEAEATIAHRFPAARLEVRAFNHPARDFYRARGWVDLRSYDATECGAPVKTWKMGKSLVLR